MTTLCTSQRSQWLRWNCFKICIYQWLRCAGHSGVNDYAVHVTAESMTLLCRSHRSQWLRCVRHSGVIDAAVTTQHCHDVIYKTKPLFSNNFLQQSTLSLCGYTKCLFADFHQNFEWIIKRMGGGGDNLVARHFKPVTGQSHCSAWIINLYQNGQYGNSVNVIYFLRMLHG
jgi:hypothetical protein